MNTLKTQTLVHSKLISRSLYGSLALAALMFVQGSVHAGDVYFDTNGATAGSGVTSGTAYGTWEGTNLWSTSSAGTVSTSAWTSGDDAIFSAGTDADPLNYSISVEVGTTVDVGSITKRGGGIFTINSTTGFAANVNLISGIFDIQGGGLVIGSRAYIGGTSGLTKNGAGQVNFSGAAAAYTGDTVVNAGSLTMASARHPVTSRLILNNSGIFQSYGSTNTAAGISGASTTSFVENGYGAGVATITTSKASGEESYAGTVRNGGASSLSIVKKGVFIQRFSGDNTYTGTTTVTAGTLIINGDSSAANGAVSVGAAGTLSGTGTIGGATTLDAGGILSAGDSGRGLLTFSNGLNISAVNDSSSLVFSLGSTGDSDRIASGTLSIGGGVLGFDDFSFSAETGFGNGVYTLFSSAGLTGSLDGSNLTGLVGGLGSTLSLSGNDILLTVVPEPNVTGLILLGLALAVVVRRRFSRQAI